MELLIHSLIGPHKGIHKNMLRMAVETLQASILVITVSCCLLLPGQDAGAEKFYGQNPRGGKKEPAPAEGSAPEAEGQPGNRSAGTVDSEAEGQPSCCLGPGARLTGKVHAGDSRE